MTNEVRCEILANKLNDLTRLSNYLIERYHDTDRRFWKDQYEVVRRQTEDLRNLIFELGFTPHFDDDTWKYVVYETERAG